MEKIEADISQPQVGTLMKLWLGLYPLPATFWLFYICGPSALWLLYIGSVLTWQRPLPALETAMNVMLWSYWFIASVAVWRSAGSYIHCPRLRTQSWAWLARGIVVLVALMTLMYGPGVQTIFARLLVIYAAQVIR